MVDLKGQYKKIKSEIETSIGNVLEDGSFIQGSHVRNFESELASFNKVKYCISCGNGTDALQIALMALNLQAGDEVIIPSFTYIAPVEAAALLGLKIVLTDVNPYTYNIDPEKIKESITTRTKVILPVHLFGQCSDMEAILQLAANKKIYVVEDGAQSIGSVFNFQSGGKSFSGTMGQIGITSFFPSKNLGCYGDGGALFTNDDLLAKKIRAICNHGQEKKYYHEIIGVNSRLDSIQAAILSVKLRFLNQYILRRQEAASFYDNEFRNNPWFDIPVKNSSSTHVYHQYTITIKSGSRDELKKYLESKGIPSMIYYPVPVHLQKAYAYLGYKKGAFPVSEKLSEQVLSLPMHTELTNEQLEYITKTTLSFFK